MIEIRCVKCKRLLMKSNGSNGDGLVVEVKCPKCHFITSYPLGTFRDPFVKRPLLEIEEGTEILNSY